jgi:hyperosmotically inducible periplasmic protein
MEELVRRTLERFLLGTMVSSSFCLAVVTTQSPAQEPTTSPDNTKANQCNRSNAESTADEQKENSSDRDTTRRMRQSLVKDKSLSTYAHNIKIITHNGIVTLKGPVRSGEEKTALADKTAEVADENNVNNELTVARAKNSGG